MKPKNIYVVTGSEDGVIAARTAAKAAIMDALAYVHGDNLPLDCLQGYKRELRKRGHTTVHAGGLGISADVEHFIDQ